MKETGVLKIKTKIFPLISICALLYIRYYETVLYQQIESANIKVLDILYSYISIPVFYIFLTMYIVLEIFNGFNLLISTRKCMFIKYLIILLSIAYMFCIVIVYIKADYIKIYKLCSKFTIIYILVGVICSFAINNLFPKERS